MYVIFVYCQNPFKIFVFKGRIWGLYMGVWVPLEYPLLWVPFSSSYLVPILSYLQKILIRTLIFHIFTRVENKPLKQRLKQKWRIILKYLINIFSFAKLKEHFCFIKKYIFLFNSKSHSFLWYTEQKKVTGHSFYEGFDIEFFKL